MARLTLVPYTPLGSYPVLPLTADSADLPWANPGTAVDGVGLPNDGRTLMLVRNTNASPQTVTVSSVAKQNRTGDITTYSIGNNEQIVLGPFDPQGWNQPGTGQVNAVGSHINVQFVALLLPATLFQY